MTFSRKTTGTLALFGMLAVVLVGLLVLIPDTASRAAVRHHKASARLSSDFRVFHRSHRRSRLDGARWVPTNVSERISDFASLLPGLGLEPAQVVGVPEGNAGEVWLVPGTRGGCEVFAASVSGLSQPALSSTCFKTGTALAGYAIGTTQANGSNYAWGLVPNGDTTVTSSPSAGGTSVQVPVTSNVAFGVIPGGVNTFTLKAVTGKTVTLTLGKS
jgi:hypothetical protein